MALVAVSLAAALAGCQRRGDYPERPIVLVCPWSAGGGSDQISRQFASQLERELGVPVNVVNATGGAGVTGHTRGAMARPDGYTIGLITAELNMLHWRGLTSITYGDFQPLALINRDSAALLVRGDAPWKTIDELVEVVRRRPGKLKASGTAFGGIWHAALAGWLIHSGLNADDLLWISINGAAPSLQELLAGGIDVVCCSIPEAQSLLDAGHVRCLAVMADARFRTLPGVPTLKEQGVDWSLEAWRGLAAPRGVPPDRLEVLEAAVRRVATSDEYLQFLGNAGFGAAFEPPERFSQELARHDRQFGEMFRSPAFQSVRRQRWGPLLFPTLLAVTGVVVLALLAVRDGLRRPGELESISTAGFGRLVLVPLWVVLYVPFSELAGFVLTAAALTFGMLWLLGVRWSMAGGVTAILVPAVYQLFAVYLRVPFPWGWLGW